MRLLAAHPRPDAYGADLMLLAAVRGLGDRGIDVTVAVPGDGPLVSAISETGCDVLMVAFPVLSKALLRPSGILRLLAGGPWHVARLVRVLRRTRPDVVYVNTVTLPHWIVAARLRRIPVVCHVREAEDQQPRWIQRLLTAPLLLCDDVIANSRHTADHVLRSWQRLGDRVHVVHNGFGFRSRAGAGAPARDGELLVVGRLSPRKGQDVAVRALRRLHDAGWPMQLRLVGTTFPGYEWYEDELRRSAIDLGLAGCVRFDGYRADVAACNAGADIVLVPSRVEPFGNVAVEALAAGRPLVASSVGGLREIVEDGRTGVLVPPDDDEALASAIAQLLADPPRAASMAAEGSAQVRSRFSLDRYVDEVEQVLRSAARSAP
jgi:glycosyltransferase involved in cell wall biosynthesis